MIRRLRAWRETDRPHAQQVRQALPGGERSLVAFETRVGASEQIRRGGWVRDRLERVEGAEPGPRDCKGLQRQPVEQAGQVKHDLVLRDRPVPGQIGGDIPDGVVGGRDHDEGGAADLIGLALTPKQACRHAGLPERDRQSATHATRADDGDRASKAHRLVIRLESPTK
jgi:hypothetical protein